MNHIAVLPDGKSLLSCGDDDRFGVNDLTSGRELRRFDLGLGREDKNASVPHQVIAFGMSPDGRTTCSYTRCDKPDRAVYHLWDVPTGKPLARHAFARQPTFLAFSPDARQVLEYVAPPNSPFPSAKQLVIRDLRTLRPVVTLSPPEDIEFVQTFSPDGLTLAAITTRQVPKTENESEIAPTVRLWELATGQERQALATDTGRDFNGIDRLAFSADGRSLAIARDNKRIQVWDTLTGKLRWQRGGFTASVQAITFSPDSRRLVTGHGDSTILVWDVAAAARAETATGKPTAAQQEADWQALAGADARAAWLAMARFVAAPDSTVAVFLERLKPATPVPADKVRDLLVDLGSAQFADRERAQRELTEFGETIEPMLAEALKNNSSAEMRQRIDRLLGSQRVLKSPDALRRLRAVEVLGWIGSAEARTVLDRIAAGDDADRACRAARALLPRLSANTAVRP